MNTVTMLSPEAVETGVAAVDCEHGGTDVSFGHSPVPLQDDDFGPDLVVNVLPFAQQFLDVVLEFKCVVKPD